VIFSQLDQYDVAQAEGGDMGRFDEVSHHPVVRPVRGIVMRKLLWSEERDVGRVGQSRRRIGAVLRRVLALAFLRIALQDPDVCRT